MRNLALPVSLLAALSFASACTTSEGVDATLTVVNESDFVIEEIYLTEVDNPEWGRNLLAGDALFPDEELTLGVECDLYDALLVDEDGEECELEGIDLCLNDATWYIYNNTCLAFERKAQQPAAVEAVKAAPTGTAATATK